MEHYLKRNSKFSAMMVTALVIAALLAAATFMYAAIASDAQSLARGAVADATPQQKYQTAIREAGGAYKEWLRDCAQLSGEDRRSCNREAKASYDNDMAEAKRILQMRDAAPKGY